MGKFRDLTDVTFGRLTALSRAGYTKDYKVLWLCRCSGESKYCKKETVVIGKNLLSGNTSSCGCIHKEKLAAEKTVHGLRRTKLYEVWKAMRQRCCNTNSKDYKNYGGRGVKICVEWLSSFETFYKWALTNGYMEGLRIERKDNDGDYCPENCRWETATVQSRNQRELRSNSSGHRGVYLNKKTGTYTASISKNKKSISLGTYRNIDDAIAARREAEKKHWSS